MIPWRGRLELAGGWLPPDWVQPGRLLQVWIYGCQRYCVGPWGALLLWPKTRFLECHRLPAVPLVACNGGWASSPRFRPAPGEVWLGWQGEVLKLKLDQLAPGDPGILWNDPLPEAILTRPLQLPQGPPEIRLVQVETGSLREVLPSAPLASQEQLRILQRLQQPESSGLGPAAGEWPRNPLLGFFDLLKSQFGHGENQQYFRKMVALFEQNRLSEALRYAIPLEGNVAVQRLQAFFGSLIPRKSLDFTSSGSGRFLGTSPDALGYLRNLYEKALERLLAEGRIEEAAFVCGELLGRYGQAVDLLEKAGRLKQAARLASLKGLEISLQARLWLLAGELSLAMQLARRGWCQAQLIDSLRSTHPEVAEAFQATWARDLAAAGRLGEALRIGLQVRAQLDEWESWLLECFSLEDAELQFVDEESLDFFPQIFRQEDLRRRFGLGPKVCAWLLQEDLFSYPARRRLLEGLVRVRLRLDHDVQQLGRDICRKVLRQAEGPFPLGEPATVQEVVRWSGDPWLTADLPVAKKSALRLDAWRQRVVTRGQLPLWDAVRLSDGRLLVAAGAAGVHLLSRHGRRAQVLSWVCHRWIVPEKGQLLIGLGRCDEVVQLTRYHSASSRSQPWCSVALDAFSSRHDGFLWPVLQARQLFLIDVRSSGWSAPQSLPFRDCTGVEAYQARLRLTRFEQGQSWESLYHYPEMKFLSRQPIDPRRERASLNEKGLVRYPLEIADGVCRGYRQASVLRRLPVGGELELEVQAGFVVARVRQQQGMWIQVVSDRRCFDLELPGAERASARVCGEVLVVADSCGRLLGLDLQGGEWLFQLFL